MSSLNPFARLLCCRLPLSGKILLNLPYFLLMTFKVIEGRNKLYFGTVEAQAVFIMPLFISAFLSPYNTLLLDSYVPDSALVFELEFAVR